MEGAVERVRLKVSVVTWTTVLVGYIAIEKMDKIPLCPKRKKADRSHDPPQPKVNQNTAHPSCVYQLKYKTES